MMLGVLWWGLIPDNSLVGFYFFVLGFVLLLELTIIQRHLRNLFLFLTAFGPAGIRGRVEYPRRIILQVSTFDLLEFAELYVLLFLFTWNWFVLGGAAGCVMSAVKQYRQSRAHKPEHARPA